MPIQFMAQATGVWNTAPAIVRAIMDIEILFLYHYLYVSNHPFLPRNQGVVTFPWEWMLACGTFPKGPYELPFCRSSQVVVVEREMRSIEYNVQWWDYVLLVLLEGCLLACTFLYIVRINRCVRRRMIFLISQGTQSKGGFQRWYWCRSSICVQIFCSFWCDHSIRWVFKKYCNLTLLVLAVLSECVVFGDGKWQTTGIGDTLNLSSFQSKLAGIWNRWVSLLFLQQCGMQVVVHLLHV